MNLVFNLGADARTALKCVGALAKATTEARTRADSGAPADANGLNADKTRVRLRRRVGVALRPQF